MSISHRAHVTILHLAAWGIQLLYPSVEAFCSSTTTSLYLPNDRSHVVVFSSSSPSRSTGELDLASYFKPDFQDAALKLSANGIVDMIPKSSSSESTTATNPQPLRQQLFTSPLISVLYERVLPPLWEAGLRIGGPEAEYKAAADFLLKQEEETTRSEPSVLLDLSCGTGFVGQRFALAQQYDHVFCLDYSSQMLGELVNSLQRQSLPANKLSIVRGDACNLPFEDNSVDAIHWGAAMHCVPNAEQALREVYRVLKPGGGKLYATTFLRPFPDVVFRFFTVEELDRMAKEVGFGRSSSQSSSSDSSLLQVEGKGVYGIVKAIK